MALGLDFLTQVVNVHWGGKNVFVAGDSAGAGAYHKPANEPTGPTWTVISGLPFTNPPREHGSIYASSYGLVGATAEQPGKPTFLLGGYRFHEEDFGTWDEGIIMASKDGVTWQKVYSFVGIPYQDEIVTDEDGFHPHHEGQSSSAFIHSIVWDGKTFWAGGFVDEQVRRSPVFHFTKSDVLLSSSDGFSWSEAGRNKQEWTNEEGEPKLPKKGLLVPHCSYTFTDANGNGIPGGAWGEDKAKKIKIGPAKPPTVDYTGNDFRSSSFVMAIGTNSSVQIIGASAATTVDTGVPGVMGVAFAGGTWWAVGSTIPADTDEQGSSSAAYSVDDGETWTPGNIKLAHVAMTVCGGTVETETA